MYLGSISIDLEQQRQAGYKNCHQLPYKPTPLVVFTIYRTVSFIWAFPRLIFFSYCLSNNHYNYHYDYFRQIQNVFWAKQQKRDKYEVTFGSEPGTFDSNGNPTEWLLKHLLSQRFGHTHSISCYYSYQRSWHINEANGSFPIVFSP